MAGKIRWKIGTAEGTIDTTNNEISTMGSTAPVANGDSANSVRFVADLTTLEIFANSGTANMALASFQEHEAMPVTIEVVDGNFGDLQIIR